MSGAGSRSIRFSWLANGADSSNGWKAQAFSNKPILPNRPYHIMLDMQGSGGTGEVRMWVDGVLQTTRAGTVTSATMATHSGDWSFGEPDGNLDTGDTDILYKSASTLSLSNWGTWSNTGGGAPLTETQIRDELFRDGAPAEYSISAGTEAAMQTAIEAYDSSTHTDWPLTYNIPESSAGAFALTITDQVFPDEVSLHLRYTGGADLTIRNSGTSNMQASKVYTPLGATVTILETALASITVRDISDNALVQNARVFMLADTGGPLPAQESCTITRAGSTATVAHTAHGVPDGTDVLIAGSNQAEYNGIHTVTVTSANAYTYTVSGTPTTPATGTITSTSVILNALTSALGVVSTEIDYSSSQPYTGYVRKGTATPRYRTAPIAGNILADGADDSVFLISDES